MAERRKKIVEQLEKGRPVKKPQYITTGNTLRDLMIGGGEGMGHKVGKLYNVVAWSQVGKTFLLVQSIVANHFKLGKKFVWNMDIGERGDSFDAKKLYDMDTPFIDEDTLISDTVEGFYNNLRSFSDKMKKDQIGLYVLDSLDGITSEDMVERGNDRYDAYKKDKEFDTGTMAMAKPKFLSSEFFPTIMSILDKRNVVLVIISQLRDKVGASKYEKASTRAGGKALDFFCHTIEELSFLDRREMEDKGSGLRSGVPIRSINTKSKTARPYRKANMVLDYSIGVDNIASNIDYLYDLRTDTGKLRGTIKNKLDWDGVLYTRDELCDFVYDNELEAELEKRVITKWEEAESRLKNRRKPRFK